MSELYTTTTTHAAFQQQAAIIEATDREYWANKHAELVRLDDWLCETFGFSRAGRVKGEAVTVKTLRGIVDK